MQIAILLAITSSSTILYLGILTLVLLSGPWRGTNRIFALFLLGSIVWNLGGLLMLVDARHAIAWNRVLVIGSLSTFVTFFHFVLLFLNIKGRQLLLYTGYILFAIVGMLTLRGFIIEEVTVTPDSLVYKMGPAMYLVLVVAFVYLGWSLFLMIQRYRATQDELYRNKLRYLLVGAVFVMVTISANAVPAVGTYGVDHLGNIVMALLVGYAILKYRLLGLRFVFRRGLVYSGLTITITAIYLLVVFSVERLLRDRAGYSNAIAAVVAAVLVAAAFLPSRNLTQRWVDRLFFRERYDYQGTIRATGKAMTEILNLEELASTTMDRIAKVMHIANMGLFVLEGNEYVSHPQLRQGYAGPSAEHFRLRRDSPIVHQLATRDNPLKVEDIGTIPSFRGLWKEERELLRKLEAAIFLPLKARGQLVGALALGTKRSGESYSRDELDLFSTLANNMAIAVDNARLFDEARRSYEQLKSAQDYLVQSERLRALGEMASGVAHDFNNLLAAILGRAQLALSIAHEEKVIKNLKVIEEAALGGAATVQRLQTFTRLRTGQDLGPVDLNDLVGTTMRMVEAHRAERQEMAGVQIDVVTRLGKVGPVQGNAGELRDALTNIVLNAIDAMPQGGRLTVETGQESNLAVVSVSDNGVGIPEEVRHRIFDPFFTTKGSRGSGLGLSVAYGVVTRHGGRIDVESEAKKGSAFHIKLPVMVQADKREAVPGNIRHVPGAAVLLVDDNPAVGDVLRLMLVQAGYETTLVTSGEQALESFRRNKYDLVITDLGMPGMSGKDIAAETSKVRPGTPTILITGWGVQLDRGDMARAGIVHMLAKPFSREDFLSQVAQSLQPTQSSSGGTQEAGVMSDPAARRPR